MEKLLASLEELVVSHGVRGEKNLNEREKIFLRTMGLFHDELLKFISRVGGTIHEQSEFVALFGRMDVLMGRVREPEPWRKRKRRTRKSTFI